MTKHAELLISFVLLVILVIGYIGYTWFIDSPDSHLLGLALGIAALLLMLMTETLYTMRKRLRWVRFGSLRV